MFNYNTLEKDIEKLSREVMEKKNLAENRECSERDIIKQAITPLVFQIKCQPVKKINDSHAVSNGEETFLPDYLKDSSVEIKLQVEKLVESVFNDGLEKTIKKATTSNAFVLDAFHDALTDKLYNELKTRKLI